MSEINIGASLLISSNDKYSIFSDPDILPIGKFFSETLEEHFDISSDNEKVVFEVLSDNGLPVVKVSRSIQFKGKKNNWEGKLCDKAGSLGMTYFLQRHLVFIFSNSKDFTNKAFLNGLIQSSSNIKNTVETKLDSLEVQTLYYFWD